MFYSPVLAGLVVLMVFSPVRGCMSGMGGDTDENGNIADNAYTTSPTLKADFAPPADATAAAAAGNVAARNAIFRARRRPRDAGYEPLVGAGEPTTAPPVATTSAGDSTGTPGSVTSAPIPQGSSIDGATATLQKDFETSFDAAIKDLGITLPTTAKVDYSSLKAAAVHLIGVESIATAQNGDAVAEGGTVTRTCSGPGSCNEPYKQTASIKIKDGPFLSGRDWKNLATSLQVQLSLVGYKFYSPLVVTD